MGGGDDTATQGWLQPVNGFYRLTRGSYAQFKVPLPYPEQAIDTILAQIKNYEFLQNKNLNGCNILDVVYPLWLCAKQTSYRKEEIRQFMEKILEIILPNYISKKSFAFAPNENPSLTATEMWSAIIYTACDYLGCTSLLTYQPYGIHRLTSCGL